MKPSEDSFTTGQLMHHMAMSLRFNADGIGKNEWAISSLVRVFAASRCWRLTYSSIKVVMQ